MDELKPCPFCETPAVPFGNTGKVGCPIHQIAMRPEQWNTRPAPSPADAGLVERLRAEVATYAGEGLVLADLAKKAAARIEALSGEYRRALEDAEREAWRVLSSWPEDKVSAEMIEAVQTRIRTLKAGGGDDQK